ncbi:MAG: hypothetical protein HY332_16755 [Chloroflexi bacterium]|nr:hypothetical protein [Chloroflexota bacterium]
MIRWLHDARPRLTRVVVEHNPGCLVLRKSRLAYASALLSHLPRFAWWYAILAAIYLGPAALRLSGSRDRFERSYPEFLPFDVQWYLFGAIFAAVPLLMNLPQLLPTARIVLKGHKLVFDRTTNRLLLNAQPVAPLRQVAAVRIERFYFTTAGAPSRLSLALSDDLSIAVHESHDETALSALAAEIAGYLGVPTETVVR